MKQKKLIHRSIAYYRRYYKLIAAAVVITVTVICGSLLVGDSVRTTLERRVSERLGDAETFIVSSNSFLSQKILDTPLLKGKAQGFLVSDGFISTNGRLVPVMVWGVVGKDAPAEGSALINSALQKELLLGHQEDLVLRLPSTGLVPSGSLFVTENYSTSMRLSFKGIRQPSDGGNISLKNEQILPFNVFVNQDELAKVLKVDGKINIISDRESVSEKQIQNIWTPEMSGLQVSKLEDGYEVSSDRVLMPDDVVKSVCQNNPGSSRLFSYLANSIGCHGVFIPYSFITATDIYKGRTLGKDEIILSDYSARRLNAQVGDEVQISYFVSQDLKTLKNDSLRLRVVSIVPIGDLQKDKTLSADFPGLSDVERCTDWDSDLPINMDLIKDEDEHYWNVYRSTPKAIISYAAVASEWGNVYGTATGIRINTAPNMNGLHPQQFGLQVVHPRESGMYAARNGVDFSSLFLALGFFIIVSALLLMLNPLSQMLYQRRNEISLLKALGYKRRRIISMLWNESAPVVLTASIIGVLFSLLYTWLIMTLLGGVWKGATQTGGFLVHLSPAMILIGLFSGIIISMLLLRYSIVRALKVRSEETSKRSTSLARKKMAAYLSAVVAVGIILVNFFIFHSVALFVTDGVILIGAAAIWGDYIISKKALASETLSRNAIVWKTLFANKKQAMLSFLALSMGVFIVFSVGLNRKGFGNGSQIESGTGGYSLWAESTVPIYHNISTTEGREKLSLTDLPSDASVLQCLLYKADDASCLNLNKVMQPSVMGIDMNALAESQFQIEQSLYSGKKSFTNLTQKAGKAYPALVDADVLTWSLGMKLGDTLHYQDKLGNDVPIILAGTISNSIFQGHILIDRSFFREIWKEIGGSEIFLLKVKDDEVSSVKTVLTQALSEYGVRVTPTNERLKEFNEVTDTYLNIFLTLGGFGLLLGIMSFIIVIRKNLTMRRKEISLFRMLGYADGVIGPSLIKENLMVPLYAIATGVISSLVGVSISFMNAGAGVWLLALMFAVLFMLCVVIFVRQSVRQELTHYELVNTDRE